MKVLAPDGAEDRKMEDGRSMNFNTTHIAAGEIPLEQWHDPERGHVSWRTLVSGDRTPTSSLVCGVAYFDPGGELKAHHHAPPEVVHVLTGNGRAMVDDVEYPLAKGDTLFIPANSVHSFKARRDGMQIFYVFGVDSFDQVEYVFESTTESSQ